MWQMRPVLVFRGLAQIQGVKPFARHVSKSVVLQFHRDRYRRGGPVECSRIAAGIWNGSLCCIHPPMTMRFFTMVISKLYELRELGKCIWLKSSV